MASRVFALLIGIDNYRSGNIWNLLSCVDDAQRIKRWLRNDLVVPEHHIYMLLDGAATKRAIEDSIMEHLVNNPEIQQGDAILIYFAGHGSSFEAPSGWFDDHKPQLDHLIVNVLCPHDQDTLGPDGRVAGISDRSMDALLADVAGAKGNNIALVLDCCFSANAPSKRNRSLTRYTPTDKCQPDDLFAGLWQSARGRDFTPATGFGCAESSSHVLLAASRPTEAATESKDGGAFTCALIAAMRDMVLHRTSYDALTEKVASLMPSHQQPFSAGKRKHEYFLDTVAFLPCHQFVEVEYLDGHIYRLGLGSLSNLKKGIKLAVHLHNLHGSANPAIGTVVVQDVHPLWCLARREFKDNMIPEGCYAKLKSTKIHERICCSLIPLPLKLRRVLRRCTPFICCQ
jgi:hypothetical protein